MFNFGYIYLVQYCSRAISEHRPQKTEGGLHQKMDNNCTNYMYKCLDLKKYFQIYKSQSFFAVGLSQMVCYNRSINIDLKL